MSLHFYNPNIHPKEEYDRRLRTLKGYLDSVVPRAIVGEYATEARGSQSAAAGKSDHETQERQLAAAGGHDTGNKEGPSAVAHESDPGSGVPLAIVGEYDPVAWKRRVGLYGGPYPLIPGAEDYEAMRSARQRRCAACYRMRFERLAELGASLGIDFIDTTLTLSPYQFTQGVMSELEGCGAAEGRKVLGSDWREFYPESVKRSRALGMYRQNYCGCHYSKQEADLERQARKEARKKDKRKNASQGEAVQEKDLRREAQRQEALHEKTSQEKAVRETTRKKKAVRERASRGNALQGTAGQRKAERKRPVQKKASQKKDAQEKAQAANT